MTKSRPLISPILKVDEHHELRLPQEQDAYQLARVVDDNRPYLRTWLPWLDASQSMQDSLAYIQKLHVDWSLHGVLTTLIFRGEVIVGAVGFHSYTHRYLALGYWVAQDAAGRGLCARASQCLVGWAFAHHRDLNLIELRAASENLASRRVAEKLGFRKDGELRQREWLYSRFVDHTIYSLTREEWEKKQGAS